MSFKRHVMACAVLACPVSLAQAELIFDSGSALSGDMVITADQGVTRGTNLLHSFQSFSVRAGESATFTGPDVIDNIVARVNGTEATEIDGVLRSTISSANLFLLNPNGIAVGPNATLEVDGGLYLSTAHSMTFQDGSVLLVSDSGNSSLTTAPPSSFGFDVSPADIVLDRPVIESVDSLSLIGGGLTLDRSRINLPGGDVQLAALASEGIATFLDGLQVEAAERADIVMTGSGSDGSLIERLETTGSPAGRIEIVAKDLTLSEGALIFADTAGDQSGDGIAINLTGDLSLSQGSRITTDVLETGAGSDIFISAANIHLTGRFTNISSNNGALGAGGGLIQLVTDTLALADEAQISSTTVGEGAAGIIQIAATDVSLTSGATLSGQSLGAGRGGEIDLNLAGSLLVSDPGTGIRVSTLFDGDAGSISINASQVTLAEQAEVSAIAEFFDSGSPGTVTVIADDVSVSGAALISTTNFSDLSAGGQITITADNVLLDGASPDIPELIFSGVQSSTLGSAGGGDIQITGALTVSNGAAIATQTESDGDGGSIFLTGDIKIEGGRVDGRTLARGNGGTVNISGDLAVTSSGSVDTSSINFATGNAGVIVVTGSTVSVSGAGSSIASQTQTSGQAGSVVMDVETILVRNGGSISTSTESTARGGSIALSADSIEVSDRGVITVTASGEGDAGNVSLSALDQLRVLDNSRIETNAARSGGGNVDIAVVNQIYLRDSTLTASSGGPEVGNDGGNVQIDPILFVLDNTRIVAQAVEGNGGLINLIAENLISDTNSLISATSERGNNGEVVISSPDNSVTGVIGTLDASFSEEEVLLSEPCAARVLRERSSLVVAPSRGGQVAPDDYQWVGRRDCR